MVSLDPARLKPWIGDPPRTTPPEQPGYVQVAHERFDMMRGSVYGFALLPFWWIALAGSVALLGGRTQYDSAITILNLLLGGAIAFIAVPLLHEGAHGIVASLFGARPSYGVGPGFAYTTFQQPLARWPYLVVGLTPLVVLSVLCVLIAARWDDGAGWLLFLAMANAGGAIGDLWMSWRIVRAPANALFFDLADGFAVLVPAR